MIRAWVNLWDQRERPWGVALVRILLPLVLLSDLLEAWTLGLVEVLWAPPEVGGLPANLLGRTPLVETYRWFAAEPTTATWLHALTCMALLMLSFGFLSRFAALASLLLYAQLAMVLPLGDRGIDLLIRNMLLLLVFAPAGKAMSLDALRRTNSFWGDRSEHVAWPRYLMVLQLFVVYWMAGVQKTALTWTPLGGYHALYIILQDPHIARFDFTWLRDWWVLSSAGTATTHIWEWTAPLIPLSMYFRYTHERAGRVRAFFNRWRVLHVYVLVGVVLHFGIAVTMNLGIFSWAMLSMYPAFFHADEYDRARDWLRGRLGLREPDGAEVSVG